MSNMESIGIGLIGVGGVAVRWHLPAWKKLADDGLVRIVALCDVDGERVSNAARQFGISNAVTDYNDLLAMDDVHAVDICTPNFLHKEHALAAFAAGKHVICEKPIALNGDEGSEMVKAAERCQKKFQVALNLRFASAPQAVKRFIDAGKLGNIYYARAHALRRRGIPAHGFFTQKDKQGGGPLIDIGVHILDLTLWFMGNPKPVAVSGAAYAKFGKRNDIIGLRGQWDPKLFSVEDFASAYIRFENGATVSLESSFAANLEKDVFQASLFGDEGGAYIEPFNPASTRIYREECGALTDISPVFLPATNAYELELQSFVRAIANDLPVSVPGEQALTITRIIDAIYESSETGREVAL